MSNICINSLWSFVLIMIHTIIFHFFQLGLWYSVRPISQSAYRRLVSTLIVAPWVQIISSIFPQSAFHISGSFPTDPSRPAILMANHQVDVDWFYIWQIAQIFHGGGNIKIVLKDELRKVPIIGWGMQMLDFLFLKRKLKKDANYIQEKIKSFANDNYPFWLVIFPEGTTIHTEAIETSKEYALKTKRNQMDKLLLPRTTGLSLVFDSLKEAKMNVDVYDLTIAYESYSGEIPTYKMGYSRKNDTKIPSLKSLFSGQAPKNVYIHCEKYSMNQIISLESWIDTCWKRKEERLNYFIQHQTLLQPNENKKTIEIYPQTNWTFFIKVWICLWCSCFLSPIVGMFCFPAFYFWVLWTLFLYFLRQTKVGINYIKELFIVQGRNNI